MRCKLDRLHSAVDINDLRVPPGNRLEALKGKLQGLHGIRVSNRWLILFGWREETAYKAELTDYH